jgi:uncharacterized protein (DUF1800 family)
MSCAAESLHDCTGASCRRFSLRVNIAPIELDSGRPSSQRDIALSCFHDYRIVIDRRGFLGRCWTLSLGYTSHKKDTMARGQLQIEHLLRRAGFGASAADLAVYESMSVSSIVERLIEYERVPDDVDAKIGQAEYVGVTARGAFSPSTSIEDARQRWLFRMVHSQRQLQEKMTLFWHNHFATAYSKLNGTVGTVQATKMMALKAGELPGPQGQIELLRQLALGSFRDLLIETAKDPAMIVWLDGRLNTRLRPQENFGREVMELFTFGIGNFTEQDVYAAARVFTGWNLRLVGARTDDPGAYYEFAYNANQHDTAAKEFTFPIYTNGTRTIAARAAADGMQDGIDFLTALAHHPETARRLARKLWGFFISEITPPDAEFVNLAANIYLQSDTRIKPVVQFILRSRWFENPGNWFARYSWPAEYVARSIKEVGWNGFSVDSARTPLTNMGQTLFEPPDVNGWELGPGWFSTGGMLARMNFAATLTSNQRFNLRTAAVAARSSPEQLVSFFLDRLSPMPFESGPYDELQGYVRAGGDWTGSDAQVLTKAAGLVHLIVGASEYQFV